MKKYLLPLLLAGILAISACRKEVFPKDDDIVGNWVEKDAAKDTADLWHLRITEDHFDTYFQGTQQNSLTWDLDKECDCILLFLPGGGASASSLEITYYKREDVLGIHHFFVGIPEESHETKFERE